MIDRPLILLGAPGSGKGTLTRILTRIWPIPAIATGALLWKKAEGDGALAVKLRAGMASGELVSDDLVNQIVAGRLAEPDCYRGFVLDGYPRNRSQAQYLDKLVERSAMPTPVVIELVVSPSIALDRLMARLLCPACGAVYNLRDHLPAHPGICDHDGMVLLRRSDDKEEVVINRLAMYEQAIVPLRAYCQSHWDYHRIDGEQPPGNLLEAVEDVFLQRAGVFPGATLPAVGLNL